MDKTLLYGMSKWYLTLEQFTFESSSVELTKEDMENILKSKQMSKPTMINIKNILKKYTNVFIRLENKSPKYLEPIDIKSINGIYKILNCSRTVELLRDCLDRNENCLLWLRRYKNFDDMLEFRIFVVNNKITAITQNDCNKKSEIVLKPSIYKKIIINFTNQLICYNDCTIDIAINKNTKDCYLVEINTPYTMLADGGLFDNEIDRHLLEGNNIGYIPFRFYTSNFYEIDEI